MYRLHYAPDNASLIIRLVLDAHAIPYELALVDRSIDAQNSDAYRAVNPTGLIPALETPDGILFETGAILLWLGDRHGMTPAPDHADRGALLTWLFFTSNTLHADLLALFYNGRYAPALAEAESHRLLIGRLRRHLSLLDAVVRDRPALFDAKSILAPYVLTLVRWAALYPEGDLAWLKLDDTPALAALARAHEALPATQLTAAAEGLGPTPFSAPIYADPPEGSAT